MAHTRAIRFSKSANFIVATVTYWPVESLLLKYRCNYQDRTNHPIPVVQYFQ